VKCKDDGALAYDPEKARALLKDYGKPVAFKMLVTATPRGRAVGQVLQQFWKQVGADMEIEQVDQTSIVTRAFARQFQLTPWRIRNTYYAIGKSRLKGLPKLYSGIIDVSDTWLE